MGLGLSWATTKPSLPTLRLDARADFFTRSLAGRDDPRQLRLAHKRGRDLLDGAHAALLHGTLELGPQQLEHALDAGLAEGTEAPQIGPSDAHALGAHGERLDDVGAAAEPAVDQHRDFSTHRLHHLAQAVDGRAPAVLPARAVVRHD